MATRTYPSADGVAHDSTHHASHVRDQTLLTHSFSSSQKYTEDICIERGEKKDNYMKIYVMVL